MALHRACTAGHAIHTRHLGHAWGHPCRCSSGCPHTSPRLAPCSYYGLKPDIKVIAPWREWDLNSRTKLIAYAEQHGIAVGALVACGWWWWWWRVVACGWARDAVQLLCGEDAGRGAG